MQCDKKKLETSKIKNIDRVFQIYKCPKSTITQQRKKERNIVENEMCFGGGCRMIVVVFWCFEF